MFKDYAYNAVDGDHWNDIHINSKELRHIDLTGHVPAEDLGTVSVIWDTVGIGTGNNFITDNMAFVQVQPTGYGSFTLKATITSTDTNNATSMKVVPMVLKVY